MSKSEKATTANDWYKAINSELVNTANKILKNYRDSSAEKLKQLGQVWKAAAETYSLWKRKGLFKDGSEANAYVRALFSKGAAEETFRNIKGREIQQGIEKVKRESRPISINEWHKARSEQYQPRAMKVLKTIEKGGREVDFVTLQRERDFLLEKLETIKETRELWENKTLQNIFEADCFVADRAKGIPQRNALATIRKHREKQNQQSTEH